MPLICDWVLLSAISSHLGVAENPLCVLCGTGGLTGTHKTQYQALAFMVSPPEK